MVFIEDKNIGLAKFKIAYNAKNFKTTKCLLVDLSKAYDMVNRERLREIITQKVIDEIDRNFILDLVDIHDSLQYIILGSIVNPERGFVQGWPVFAYCLTYT